MPTGLYRGNAYIAIDEMASELLYLRFVAVDIWQDDIAQGQEGRTERKIEDDQRNQHPAERMVSYTIDFVVTGTNRTPPKQ